MLSLTFAALGYRVALNRPPTPADAPSPAPAADAKLDPAPEEDVQPEDIPDGDLAAVSAGFLEPCKMVHGLRAPTNYYVHALRC